MREYLRLAFLGIVGGLIFGLLLGSVQPRKASAQDHHGHPPQDQAIHERFYSTWMMPDNRGISCCHNDDCAPAESHFENGQLVARKVGDEGGFTPVPPRKIEHDRDTPDGQSHICERRYGFSNGEFSVFCFISGYGG